MCFEMFNCLQAELATVIRKRKFLNKFSVINIKYCVTYPLFYLVSLSYLVGE